jgi:hypothetical protein
MADPYINFMVHFFQEPSLKDKIKYVRHGFLYETALIGF